MENVQEPLVNVEIEKGSGKKAGPSVDLNEETRQSLDILKATEVLGERAVEEKTNETKTAETGEKTFETEIAKQVVASFVEKEILKLPELPQSKTEPENLREETAASFVDWLALIKKNNGQPDQETQLKSQPEKARAQISGEEKTTGVGKDQARKEKNKALIDKIIETNPGLIKNKEAPKFFTPETKAKESLLENEHLVTETLARIYALQGNVNKAVRAYEILSLKYPQKSAYFASLIKQLKEKT